MQKFEYAFHERVALDLLAETDSGSFGISISTQPTLIAADIRVEPRSSSRPPTQPSN